MDFCLLSCKPIPFKKNKQKNFAFRVDPCPVGRDNTFGRVISPESVHQLPLNIYHPKYIDNVRYFGSNPYSYFCADDLLEQSEYVLELFCSSTK